MLQNTLHPYTVSVSSKITFLSNKLFILVIALLFGKVIFIIILIP